MPRHIIPSEYAAEMIPFIVEDNFTIAGNVDMTFNFTEVGLRSRQINEFTTTCFIHFKDGLFDDQTLRRKVVLNYKLLAIDESSVR